MSFFTLEYYSLSVSRSFLPSRIFVFQLTCYSPRSVIFYLSSDINWFSLSTIVEMVSLDVFSIADYSTFLWRSLWRSDIRFPFLIFCSSISLLLTSLSCSYFIFSSWSWLQRPLYSRRLSLNSRVSRLALCKSSCRELIFSFRESTAALLAVDAWDSSISIIWGSGAIFSQFS